MSAPAKGHTAVRAQKRPRLSDGHIWQQDELFPTPPWATRALIAHVLPKLLVRLPLGSIWEPCAGLGHMADVLREFSDVVVGTDKNVYELAGGGSMAGQISQVDFLQHEIDLTPDWIITNPPFGPGLAFAQRALSIATTGVALLLRLQWIEGARRYEALFRERPPFVAPFVERVAMCEGGWDPRCSTATGYAWFVWVKDRDGFARPARNIVGAFDGFWIPPCKAELSRPTDALLARRCVPGFVPPSTLRKTLHKTRKDLPRLDL